MMTSTQKAALRREAMSTITESHGGATSLIGTGQPWTVHEGDARNTAKFLEAIASATGKPAEPFLTTTITSPPYANLVDYGVDGQIGYGQSFDEYVNECRRIFEAVHEWTKADGSLWMVVDSLVQKLPGGMPSRLVPLPFLLSEVASAAGWILRDVIIWRKDRTRPWSNKGRLRNGFEYVLYFVKTNEYKYHVDRLRDLRGLKSWWVKYPERHNPWGMTPDNVWEIPIPVQGSWATSQLRHACPFPPELVRRIVSLTTDEGDVVFDPFAGSGTVAAVSEGEKRLALGTELNPEFVSAFQNHVRPEVLDGVLDGIDVDADDLTGKLLTLRVLKYPKDLIRQILRGGAGRHEILGALVTAEPFDVSPRRNDYARISCRLIVAGEVKGERRQQLSELVERVQKKHPLSLYGVTATVELMDAENAVGDDPVKTYALYVRGRTWASSRRVSSALVPATLLESASDSFPVILSPIEVNEALEEL